MKRNFDERWDNLLETGNVRAGDAVRHKTRTGAVLPDGRIKETGVREHWRDPVAFACEDNSWNEAKKEEYTRKRKMLRSCVCVRGGVETKLWGLLARKCDDPREEEATHVDQEGEEAGQASMSAGTHFLTTGPGEWKQAWAGDAAVSFDAAKVYVAQENQTPRQIARNLGVSLELLLAFNRGDVGGLLRPSSKFRSGTVLYVPPASRGRSPEAKGMERSSRLAEVMRHVLSRMDSHEHVLMVGCCSRALCEAAACPMVWRSMLRSRFGEDMLQQLLASGSQGKPPAHEMSTDGSRAKGGDCGQFEQARGSCDRGRGRNEIAAHTHARTHTHTAFPGTALEILNMLVW